MWWVKERQGMSRGGFQNRDVGKTLFDDNYGPDYGIDYARFSDPPDLQHDYQLQHLVEYYVESNFPGFKISEVFVRNGFVFLKTHLIEEEDQETLIASLRSLTGVKDVQVSLVNE
jgi:hypothetical protein